MSDKLEFQEPTGEESEAAGYRIYKRAKSPYEQWMEEEGIPVFRGVGVYNTRELDLAPWKRMGGKGAMRDWVTAGLGQLDRVHFTAAGYQRLASALFADLSAQYEIYRKARMEIDQHHGQTDQDH